MSLNIIRGRVRWWRVHSQREVLSFLPHDADSTFFGQDGGVLVTDLLIEKHVGVPVPPPDIRVGVSCTETNIHYIY